MTTIYGRDLERAKLVQQSIEKYTKPTPCFIGDSAGSRKLYAAEAKRSVLIGQCAAEWSKIMGVDKAEYWKRAIPQALYDIFDGYEMGAAVVAAEAFLERYGYTITRPKFED